MEKQAGLPNHVAIIMDGNGRWAEKRDLPRFEGHRAGLKSTRTAVRIISEYHVKYLTLFSFSTENWSRPKAEVSSLFKLLQKSIKKELNELIEANIRLKHLGRLDRLPPALQGEIEKAIEITKGNDGMILSLAFDYGSRAEITEVARRIVADGIAPEQIDETLFSSYLFSAGLPDVDLVIRTGGEYRLSNFLLWHSAYSEYYFSDILWPDYNRHEIEKALNVYSQRKRRFGGL
jgi:undecaprenyl diphosphate synthase